MRRSSVRPALAAVFVVVGFMLATAFNTSTRVPAARGGRSVDLAGLVRDMEAERDTLRDRLGELRGELAGAEGAAARAGDGPLAGRLEEARSAAGLTALRGRGVVAELADAASVPEGVDAADCVVHDSDIAAVVNALWAGGAEAVSVNGERVVATTPIRCAGTTVLVNSTRVGSPYVISAVGDPETLEAAVRTDAAAGALLGGEYRALYGLLGSIRRTSSVAVPAHGGAFTPRYLALDGGQ